MVLPLLGERAGVRGNETPDLIRHQLLPSQNSGRRCAWAFATTENHSHFPRRRMSYWHHPLCAKRLECAQLAAAVARPATPESAGKLDALQTLRAGRTPGALVDLLGFCLSPAVSRQEIARVTAGRRKGGKRFFRCKTQHPRTTTDFKSDAACLKGLFFDYWRPIRLLLLLLGPSLKIRIALGEHEDIFTDGQREVQNIFGILS